MSIYRIYKSIFNNLPQYQNLFSKYFLLPDFPKPQQLASDKCMARILLVVSL